MLGKRNWFVSTFFFSFVESLSSLFLCLTFTHTTPRNLDEFNSVPLIPFFYFQFGYLLTLNMCDFLLQVQAAVTGLRDSAASRTSQLQQEMSTMREDTAAVKDNWTVYVDKTESQYLEDTSAVENGKKDLEGVLHSWYADTYFMTSFLAIFFLS